MNFAYLGTDRFAGSVLAGLVERGLFPSLVVSRPDSRQGRGRRLTPPPTAATAAELGIDLVQPESANGDELESELAVRSIDLLVLCAYGAIIREPMLSRRTILNLHPSLLPRWRGAAPIERALMAGDSVTGACVIELVEELDAGPVALRAELPIDAADDFASLSGRLVDAGVDLLCAALAGWQSGDLEFTPQPTEGVSYAERIEPADRLLDPGRPAEELERSVRALTPHIGARLELPDGRILGVRSCKAIADGPASGEVESRDGKIVVGCARGALAIDRIIPPGGREMDAADWLRGGGAGLG